MRLQTAGVSLPRNKMHVSQTRLPAPQRLDHAENLNKIVNLIAITQTKLVSWKEKYMVVIAEYELGFWLENNLRIVPFAFEHNKCKSNTVEPLYLKLAYFELPLIAK